MSASQPAVSSSVLGFPRMGAQRELKFALEAYWAGKQAASQLLETAAGLRRLHWRLQREAGVDVVASNDASLYDHTLDHALLFSAVPPRYAPLAPAPGAEDAAAYLPLYFAMARGFQGKHGDAAVDVQALEMKKWYAEAAKQSTALKRTLSDRSSVTVSSTPHTSPLCCLSPLAGSTRTTTTWCLSWPPAGSPSSSTRPT